MGNKMFRTILEAIIVLGFFVGGAKFGDENLEKTARYIGVGFAKLAGFFPNDAVPEKIDGLPIEDRRSLEQITKDALKTYPEPSRKSGVRNHEK
jgi:hypothetical protein